MIGEWTTVGTHGLVPGTTYHGRTSFEWLEGGQYLIFLRPFYWTPGDNTGQYTITGDRGLYELDAKAQQYSFRGGVDSPLARIVYGLVGLSALYQLLPLVRSFGRGGETRAQHG